MEVHGVAAERAQQGGGEGAVLSRRTIQRGAARRRRVEFQAVGIVPGEGRLARPVDPRGIDGLLLAPAVGGIIAAVVVDAELVSCRPGRRAHEARRDEPVGPRHAEVGIDRREEGLVVPLRAVAREVEGREVRPGRRRLEPLDGGGHRRPSRVLHQLGLQPHRREGIRDVGSVALHVGQRRLPVVFRVADDQRDATTLPLRPQDGRRGEQAAHPGEDMPPANAQPTHFNLDPNANPGWRVAGKCNNQAATARECRPTPDDDNTEKTQIFLERRS